MADKPLREEQIEDLPTSKVTSGMFADARIAESNVTQHEAAIDHDALTNFVAGEHFLQSAITETGTVASGTWAANLAADTVDAITEIASALKSGSDGTLVTGTAGTSGNLVEWDANGDAVDSTHSVNQSLNTTSDVTFADVQVTGEIYADGEVDNGNSGTSDTINWTTGNFQKSTMTGNVTYTFTAPSGPGRFQLMLVQDATGSRTATWPASVKWPGGTAPTLSTAASSIDIITFYYDGTDFYGVESLNFS